MPIKIRHLAIALLGAISACGNETPSSHASEVATPSPPTTDSSYTATPAELPQTGGAILILITGMEDGMVSGQSGCKVAYTATNGARKNIKFLSMDAFPALSTENPAVRSAVDARGKVAVYPGKLAKGESDNRNIGIAAARCDQIEGLTISNLLCGFENNDSCTDKVGFENRTRLTLAME
ncbi:hypothetical protein K1X12_14560 [Hyphomonas sp. WL0036]|uniref:hypothetical protein n=1 Tax=Hyphomonas sediminis TaxID=2866160 RepID=UPI001C7E9ABC|nr:hypothetical protein [Hyphomonas sediminis]MBY9068130.1 hypothetical protein [Hyphomonas sediminis]